MTHSSRLPPGTTRAQALAMLSDYPFFLACDPHLAKYELIPASEHAALTPPPSIPDNVRSQLRSQDQAASAPPKEDNEVAVVAPTCYRVTDVVHAIPAGIWDTNVVSNYEFTDIRDGLFVRIKSPLSIVMDTLWEVRDVVIEAGDGDGDGDGGLELVEDVTIQCSRLLIGIVRGQCENGWEGIHGKMIGRLEGELKK
ncbi:hypothetical protein C8A01DRAFT_38720 [Parachaetomium inaequale]|uniref:DUF7053 domain-containing protein n=1 Tax=Parachaetomium inaequale TaxID=2588326 RepID=A0AAN6PC71_9PEZI|nr:hypothetical protein C8A01DRAFT_38720 [Parachaetomium inaequale]